jgi:hypothetical protein
VLRDHPAQFALLTSLRKQLALWRRCCKNCGGLDLAEPAVCFVASPIHVRTDRIFTGRVPSCTSTKHGANPPSGASRRRDPGTSIAAARGNKFTRDPSDTVIRGRQRLSIKRKKLRPTNSAYAGNDDKRDGRLTSPITASMDFCSASMCDGFESATSAASRPTRLLHPLI